MTWQKIEPLRRTAQVSVGLAEPLKDGRQSLVIAIPPSLGGKAWDKTEHAACYIGEGEHEGLIRVEPAGDGVSVKRLLHSIIVRPPTPAKRMEGRKAVACEFTRDGDAFIITLPDFVTHRPVQERDPPVEVEHNRPPKVVGRYLVMNGHNIQLDDAQAKLIEALIKTAKNEIPQSAGDKIIGGVKSLPLLNAEIGRAGLNVLIVSGAYRLKGLPA